jgi:hypothetical protein
LCVVCCVLCVVCCVLCVVCCVLCVVCCVLCVVCFLGERALCHACVWLTPLFHLQINLQLMTLTPAVGLLWALCRLSARAVVWVLRPSAAVHPLVLDISHTLRDLSRLCTLVSPTQVCGPIDAHVYAPPVVCVRVCACVCAGACAVLPTSGVPLACAASCVPPRMCRIRVKGCARDVAKHGVRPWGSASVPTCSHCTRTCVRTGCLFRTTYRAPAEGFDGAVTRRRSRSTVAVCTLVECETGVQFPAVPSPPLAFFFWGCWCGLEARNVRAVWVWKSVSHDL